MVASSAVAPCSIRRGRTLSSRSLRFPPSLRGEPTDNPSIVRPPCAPPAGIDAVLAAQGSFAPAVLLVLDSPGGQSLAEGGVPTGRWLARPGGGRVAGQDLVQLGAGADPELGEHLLQVVLDRAGAEEQAGADLRVRPPLAGQAGSGPHRRSAHCPVSTVACVSFHRWPAALAGRVRRTPPCRWWRAGSWAVLICGKQMV